MLHLILAALLTSYPAPNPPFSRHDVAIAGDAQHTLVAWTQIDNGAARVHVAIIGGARDVALPLSGQMQLSPAIAFDGANYLVVWAEVDFRTTTAYAARVSGSGELLDAKPILIGNVTNGFPPRAAWSAGVYRVSAGNIVTTLNADGISVPNTISSPLSNVVDLALPDDVVVFARSTPPACFGFSSLFCQPGSNQLIFQPGDTISLTSKPVWIEADDHMVVWSDGTMLNVTRNGISDRITMGATNATVTGSLVVYEKNERLYSFDLDTKKETVLTEPGTVVPALLNRGNGHYTLLFARHRSPRSC